MVIKDNFSIFNLFLDKNVKISIDKQSFRVHLPTIREFSTHDKINAVYHMWTMPSEKIKASNPFHREGSFAFVHDIIFNVGQYKEYSEVAKNFKEILEFFIPGVVLDYQNKKIIVDSITITEEI